MFRLLENASQVSMDDLPIVLKQGAFLAPVKDEENWVWEIVDC